MPQQRSRGGSRVKKVSVASTRVTRLLRSCRPSTEKLLALATPWSEIGARLGCRSAAWREPAAGEAEIRPTEPGRASPAKGVRDYRAVHRLSAAPENRRHRRRRHG